MAFCGSPLSVSHVWWLRDRIGLEGSSAKVDPPEHAASAVANIYMWSLCLRNIGFGVLSGNAMERVSRILGAKSRRLRALHPLVEAGLPRPLDEAVSPQTQRVIII